MVSLTCFPTQLQMRMCYGGRHRRVDRVAVLPECHGEKQNQAPLQHARLSLNTPRCKVSVTSCPSQCRVGYEHSCHGSDSFSLIAGTPESLSCKTNEGCVMQGTNGQRTLCHFPLTLVARSPRRSWDHCRAHSTIFDPLQTVNCADAVTDCYISKIH